MRSVYYKVLSIEIVHLYFSCDMKIIFYQNPLYPTNYFLIDLPYGTDMR